MIEERKYRRYRSSPHIHVVDGRLRRGHTCASHVSKHKSCFQICRHVSERVRVGSERTRANNDVDGLSRVR